MQFTNLSIYYDLNLSDRIDEPNFDSWTSTQELLYSILNST